MQRAVLLLTVIVSAFACSSDDDACPAGACEDAGPRRVIPEGGVDLGHRLVDLGVDPVDLGEEVDLGLFPDAEVHPDAEEVFEPCGSGQAQCSEPLECGMEGAPPSNCAFCPPEHRELCLSGECLSPEVLELRDVQEVGFTVEGAFATRLEALVGVVVGRETPSGALLDCDRVTAPGFDLAGACYNVLTSRLITIFQVGQTYSFQYGTFPGDLPVLLLVYGFGDERAEDPPLGVSCTPYDAPRPGSGRMSVLGNPMVAVTE